MLKIALFCSMPEKLDPYFAVTLDLNASSPLPESGIWTAQHTTVSENYSAEDPIPKYPSEAIIKHQLAPKHFSVLEFAHVVLHYRGFPHDTVMQMVRHQGSKHLVQSMRYTGQRFRELLILPENVEALFYLQPEGEYYSREGKYSYSTQERDKDLEYCLDSVRHYCNLLDQGKPEEFARRFLAPAFRQNFSVSCSLRALFHWLDQRTLKDSQLEVRELARLTLEELVSQNYAKGLIEWYRRNREGRNLLAP